MRDRRTKTDEVLQRCSFRSLNIRLEISNFLFDPSIDFFDLQLLLRTLLSHSSFFQIEIETDTGLCSCDFLAETLFETFDLGDEALVFGFDHGEIVFGHELKFGFGLGKVDLLGVLMLFDRERKT